MGSSGARDRKRRGLQVLKIVRAGRLDLLALSAVVYEYQVNHLGDKMFRWIANLFNTADYVTAAEQFAELEESVFKAQREAIQEWDANGDTEKFQQLRAHALLLNGQLAQSA
jgi:hypothetical protein